MKLYVSTYAKYNAGNLAGRWLDLDRYDGPEEFETACRRIHADEMEPELMFQDVETDPGEDWQEGLYSESQIPREYWKIRLEKKIEKLCESRRKKTPEQQEQERLFAKFARESGWRDSKMLEYLKKTLFFVELSGGEVYEIRKPKIETRFCEGEDDRGQVGEGPGTIAYAHKVLAAYHTERGFSRANLEPVRAKVAYWESGKWREDGCAFRPHYTGQPGRGVLAADWPYGPFQYSPESWKKHLEEVGARAVNAEDARRIAAGWRRVLSVFEKRVAAWWKRFGADHVTTWTYWTEA